MIMKLWLDTVDINAIKEAEKIGILHGITTNPAILAEAGLRPEKIIPALLTHQSGPVAAQVVAIDAPNMIQEGLELNALSPRIIVKVPVTREGLEAIRHLSKENVSVMGTILFHPHQALTASIAGANYAAPYISHIENEGKDPWEILAAMQRILLHVQNKTEILAASVKSLPYLQRCAEIGIQHITIKAPLFYELVETVPEAQAWVDRFATLAALS
jgi:transaldolase